MDKNSEKSRKKYLHSLTDNVLSLYLNELIIDDKFVWKCFEHGLDGILNQIYDNQDLFKLSISTETLSDLYILMSVDADRIEQFLRHVNDVKVSHIEYAIRFGNINFLMMMWKSKKYIKNFDTIVKDLEKTMQGKQWIQLYFFDWCKHH